MRLRRTVAGNLRRIRRERGWTQEELAHRAGLDRNYVGMLERRENAATVDTLERLAEALGIDATELLRTDDPDGSAA
jgi:transcriptional regulator with XRE-family HTH domain